MATESQIFANRLNAQKSTGPQTPQGKEIVSQNAVKHGLTAANDIISSESISEFEQYRDQIIDELSPQTPVESMLAQRVVSLSWRLKRIGRIQNQAIDAMDKDSALSPLAKLTRSLLPKSLQSPHSDNSDDDPALSLGRLAIKDFSNARVLERLLMYERRIENSLYKTILELQRLNLVKKLNPASESSDPFTPTYESRVTGHEPRAMGHEPQATGHEPRVTDHEPRVTGHEPRSMGHEPQATGHEPRATGHESRLNMQNKPNLKNAQMSVSPSVTKNYENLQPAGPCKNKPNIMVSLSNHQTQFRTYKAPNLLKPNP